MLGSFNQGAVALVNTSSIVKRGTMTLRSSDTDKLSAASAQYLILGRADGDTINAGTHGWR